MIIKNSISDLEKRQAVIEEMVVEGHEQRISELEEKVEALTKLVEELKKVD